MSKQYDDPRWGLEKHLNFQEVTLTIAPPATILRSIYFGEDITVTEFGFCVTSTKVSVGNATAASLCLAVSGGNTFATLTLATTGNTGNLFRTTTIATPTAISAGSVLQLIMGSSISTGVGVPYIKYRERY